MDPEVAADIAELLIVELERRQGVNLEDDLPDGDVECLKESWVKIILEKSKAPHLPKPPPH